MLYSYLIKKLKKRGFEISKTGVTDRTSISYFKILSYFKIDTILDIGANEGQFASAMFKLGYNNAIISFEPLSDVYKTLSQVASNNNNWKTVNIALGDKDGEETINISKASGSSSLLEMLPSHAKHAPQTDYIATEKISIKKLDSIYDQYINSQKSVYVKIDVQGFEKNVIEGALNSLSKIKLIQMEVSIIPLYKGETLLADMINYMDQKGFVVYNLIPGFNNFNSGQLLQTDVIFARKGLLE